MKQVPIQKSNIIKLKIHICTWKLTLVVEWTRPPLFLDLKYCKIKKIKCDCICVMKMISIVCIHGQTGQK